jgi:hypothetical protein
MNRSTGLRNMTGPFLFPLLFKEGKNPPLITTLYPREILTIDAVPAGDGQSR